MEQEIIDIGGWPADSETVDRLFQSILGRPINNDEFKRNIHNTGSVDYWIRRLVRSKEFEERFFQKHGVNAPNEAFITDAGYRTPALQNDDLPKSVMVIGSCMTESWKRVIQETYPAITVRHQLFNSASELEDLTDAEVREFAFQIVQIPLRSMIAEAEYFGSTLSDEGAAALQRVFALSVERLRRNLNAALKYNRAMGIPTFVLNFAVPQQNPLGMLMPRYDLSNFCYYVEELNRELANMVIQERSVYLIDFDGICSSLGKRYILDDMTSHFNHGSFLGSTHTIHDIALTPHGIPQDIFAPKVREATIAIFNECVAAHRVISPSQKIKIVIFDLDGTLWRGVAAERDDLDIFLTEGWPLSIVEAAAFLKKRGILIALASKNDPENVRRAWEELYERRFPFANFVSAKISWGPKINAIGEILAETNLLPGNCLFVDDNPLEREQAKLAYPDIHVIDGPILTWKRSLLWSPELQVPFVTDESNNRTQSIQNMIKREALKAEINEEEYIASLGVTMKIDSIANSAQPKFNRALELLNKTNQFNTTGQRWNEQGIASYFANGGIMLTAEVSDRLSDYGLTAIMLVRGGECTQFVMSCRVFGLRVEFALFDHFLSRSAREQRVVLFKETEKNGPARSFLTKIGVDFATPSSAESNAISLNQDFLLPQSLYIGVKRSIVEAPV